MTVVAATKYVVASTTCPRSRTAGIEVVGENRAQDLEAKHAPTATRSAGTSSATSRAGRPRPSTASASCAIRSRASRRRNASTIPALVEVNLSGEETKSGVPPRAISRTSWPLYDDVRGLMTMPPETGDPEASRPYFRRLRELAERYGLPELSMGTSQDYLVAADEGATMVRLGSVLYGG